MLAIVAEIEWSVKLYGVISLALTIIDSPVYVKPLKFAWTLLVNGLPVGAKPGLAGLMFIPLWLDDPPPIPVFVLGFPLLSTDIPPPGPL